MSIASRFERATTVSEDDPSEIQEGLSRLKLIRGGLTDGCTEAAPETVEQIRFDLEGVDRVRVGNVVLTVLRGKVGGQPMAITTQTPPELLMPAEEGEPDTLFQSIRTGAWSKVATVLALIGAGLSAVPGCAPSNSDNHVGSNGSGVSALTAADVGNLGAPAMAAWTLPGDNDPQISEIDGKFVVTFSRDVAGTRRIFYVDCAQLENCLSGGVPAEIAGFAMASWRTAAIYQDALGNDRILMQPVGGSIRRADIGYNGGGVLEVVGGAGVEVPPGIGGASFSLNKIGGVPHLLYPPGLGNYRLRDLPNDYDGLAEMDSGFNGGIAAGYCGFPQQDDGGEAIGGFRYDPGGPGGGDEYCGLISAPNFAGLATIPPASDIASQAVGAPAGTNFSNPRALGRVLVYVRNDGGTKIWHAVVPLPPDGGVGGDAGVDAGAADAGPNDGGDGGGADANPGNDGGGADANPGGDGGGADANPGADGGADANPGNDGGADADAGPGADADAGPGADADAGPSADADAGPEGGADGPVEVVQECILEPGSVRITEGACHFDRCEDEFAKVTGNCIFEIDLGKEKPVIVQINGTYSMDLIEHLGELLSGSYRIVDNGLGFGTVRGDFGTGVDGTIYGGEAVNTDSTYNGRDTYTVNCEEGRIHITYNGEVIARLRAGDEITLDEDTGKILHSDIATDGGGGIPNDGGPTETDGTSEGDAGVENNPNQPGCSCAAPGTQPNGQNAAANLGPILLGLAGLFELSRRRRKIDKIV